MRRDTDTYGNPAGGTSETSAARTRSSGPASWLHTLARAAEERNRALGSLNRPLRLALATTISGALAAGFFIFAQNAPQAHIGVYAGNGLPNSQMPIGAFLCGLVLWVIAWSFGLTGALHGHWTMRLLVLAVFLYSISPSFVPDVHAAIYLAPVAVLYGWAGVVSVIQWRASRAKRPLWNRLPAVTFAIVAVTLSAYYLAFYLLVRIAALSATAFADLITTQIQALSFVLLPILFLAGTDFTEIGVAAAGRASALLGRLRGAWVTPLLTVGVVVGVFAVVLANSGYLRPFNLLSVYTIIEDCIIAAICTLLAAGIARVGRLRTWTARAIPPWAFVIAAVVTMASLAGSVVVDDLYISFYSSTQVVSGYNVYQHTAGKVFFSFAYPDSWVINTLEPVSSTDFLTVDTVAPNVSHTYEFTLALIPPNLQEVSDLQTASEVVQNFCECAPTLSVAGDHGLWQTRKTQTVEAFTSTSKPIPQMGNVWWQRYGDNLWVVYAHTAPSDAKTYAPIFTAMLDSWRPDLSAAAPAVHDTLPGFITAIDNWDPTGVLSLGLVPLLLGLLVGFPLLVRGRDKPGPANVAGLYLVLYGLCEALLWYPQLLSMVGVSEPHLRVWAPPDAAPIYFQAFPTLSTPQLQQVIAIVTIVMLARLALRRGDAGRKAAILGLLFATNVGLLAIAFLPRLFGANDTAGGHIHILQAIALIAAFLWDLLTSGERTASTTDKHSPRYARLLLYLGYSMVSFTLIMFVSVQNSSGNPFDLGDWTATGIATLGIPLLLALFLMAIARGNTVPVEKLMVSEPDARPPEHAVPVPIPAHAPLAPRPSLPGDVWRG